MKTITYNPETHRLVPVEPDTPLPDLPPYITRGNAGLYYYDTIQMHQYAMRYLDAVISSAPQLEPVEVEPVLYAEFSEDGGWLGEASEYQDHLEEPIALYTAPPDYEEIKRQRDELAKALESISKITGDAGFNIGGPIEHCPGELEHDEATRLLSLACEYLKDTSKAASRALASVKGGV